MNQTSYFRTAYVFGKNLWPTWGNSSCNPRRTPCYFLDRVLRPLGTTPWCTSIQHIFCLSATWGFSLVCGIWNCLPLFPIRLFHGLSLSFASQPPPGLLVSFLWFHQGNSPLRCPRNRRWFSTRSVRLEHLNAHQLFPSSLVIILESSPSHFLYCFMLHLSQTAYPNSVSSFRPFAPLALFSLFSLIFSFSSYYLDYHMNHILSCHDYHLHHRLEILYLLSFMTSSPHFHILYHIILIPLPLLLATLPGLLHRHMTPFR